LFKRILVISKSGATDKKLWDDVAEFFSTNRKNWKAKLRLQDAFQRRVVEYVENPTETPPPSQVINPTNRNRFIVEGREKVLLLIDIPLERRASSSPLEYLVEEDRKRFKREELRTENLEQSVIWKALQSSFQESIGKLRVFCHPDHAEFLVAFVQRGTFESILASALAEAEREA
jgi:hypothetical protein